MIDDQDHPEMKRAYKELMGRLFILSNGREVSRGLIDRMRDCINQHQASERAKGVDFPTLVAVVVPRLGIIHWVRADLGVDSIRTQIVNFARFNPNAKMEEIVTAFVTAFPDLKPGDVMEGRAAASAADKRQAERQKRIMREAEEIVRKENGGG